MDFEYSTEQRMLADSLARLVADNWTLARRRAREGGLDPAAWNALAELGVLGLTIDPEHGGFGEAPASLLPVHLELGRGLVDEPVIASGVMSATALRASGNAEAAARWLPAIASGAAILALAYQEPGRRYAVAPETCALSGLVLDGSKHLVWHGAEAHAWIVSARDTADGEPVLLVVPADAPGVAVSDMSTLDRSRCARIDFSRTRLAPDQVLARGEAARAALALALEWGTAALCAHAAGAIARLLDITVDYLKTRKQFGQPLAAFQALQHRMAEMVVAREMALSMAYVAAAALAEPDARTRRRMIAAAKIEAGQAGRCVSQLAVQLHGGMGMTDELEVGDFFKRLTVVELLFGDTAEQLGIMEETAAMDEAATMDATTTMEETT
ncbi:acyl-CoA dehydrogenase family protein [Achromobacter aloeverae]|uniref:Acyl-CoA dehydrogenase n=1 Tax=Achromobacter aloeverae TaxID=1750518 RepID=A0A4Q1HP19_9BURK|nr:acyl-CoA dehydrogenase [Achromobacter aloeverae]RXN92792.1 acyl-CoA dehydrogenase [Achromobacter aloeverae]